MHNIKIISKITSLIFVKPNNVIGNKRIYMRNSSHSLLVFSLSKRSFRKNDILKGYQKAIEKDFLLVERPFALTPSLFYSKLAHQEA